MKKGKDDKFPFSDDQKVSSAPCIKTRQHTVECYMRLKCFMCLVDREMLEAQRGRNQVGNRVGVQ